VRSSSGESESWRAAGRSPASIWPTGGKGSHGRLYFGDEFTTLKDRKKEIGRDLLAKMCADLKIDPHDL
jgi:mRNA interferase HicA